MEYILNLIVYVILILNVNKLRKRIEKIEDSLFYENADEDFWGEDDEEAHI